MEELVAELASAFLCADLNLTPQIREDHAAYIANWLEVLKNVCSGQGNNCVNAFVLDAAESAQLQDIFSFSLRVGFTASFSNATGGPDRLFLANSRDVGTAVSLLIPYRVCLVADQAILYYRQERPAWQRPRGSAW
jgi:hypothetical protein